MLVIGKVLKSHGIKGEIKVDSFMDTPDILLKLKEVYIDNTLYKIERTALNGSFVLFKLSGLESIEDAEKLRNKEISAKKQNLPPNKKGRYYVDEIIGCKVFDNKQLLGEVINILQYGSADVYVLENNGKQIMFPFIDGVVANINILDKKITVNIEKFLQVAVYED